MPTLAFLVARADRHIQDDDALAAAALQARGIDVVAVPWGGDVTAVRADAAVIRSCWDYHHDAPSFADWLDALETRMPLFNSASTARWNIDKRYLVDFASRNLPVPPTQIVLPGQPLDLGGASEGAGIVVKPAVSLSAFSTWHVDEANLAAVEPAIRAAHRERTMMVQPFLRSIVTEGEWSLLYFGGRFHHAVRKRPAAGDFRVQNDYGGSQSAAEAPPDVRAAADVVMAAEGDGTLYARVDLARADDGTPLLMELELVDPVLFFGKAEGAAERFAECVQGLLDARGSRAVPATGGSRPSQV